MRCTFVVHCKCLDYVVYACCALWVSGSCGVRLSCIVGVWIMWCTFVVHCGCLDHVVYVCRTLWVSGSCGVRLSCMYCKCLDYVVYVCRTLWVSGSCRCTFVVHSSRIVYIACLECWSECLLYICPTLCSKVESFINLQTQTHLIFFCTKIIKERYTIALFSFAVRTKLVK